MPELPDKFTITEVVNKLFMYTDSLEWDLLKKEVFTEEVFFDMSSLGAGPGKLLGREKICQMWNDGFKGIDSVHHQAGHYIIDLGVDQANVYAYAVATHYRAAAVNGKTRSFTGSYNLGFVREKEGWRINGFKYNLKFTDGNQSLQ
jgi:hypothetical protein